MFQQDQKGFFKSLEGNTVQEGAMPDMERFINFWGGIWEKQIMMPDMPWMDEVGRQLNEKINVANEFNIGNENITKEIMKRKSWTALGIDGIQKIWWKKLKPAQKAPVNAFSRLKANNNIIPVWWPTGRTVLIPKTKYLSDEKNYRPITCLNTS